MVQGIAFFHAGSDILRSKSLDRDSYNSGDSCPPFPPSTTRPPSSQTIHVIVLSLQLKYGLSWLVISP